MKIKTWKRAVAAVLVCLTLISSPFHAMASQDKEKEITECNEVEETKESYTKAELRLLSAIIFCEAGSESYTGKIAVGIVVMNRVRSGKFPNSIKGVVYQKNQFTPAKNGMLKKALNNYDNGKFTMKNHLDSIKAAKKVLEGCTTVTLSGKETNMKSYLFFSRYLSNRKLKIGHHMFK
jgi:spore germination cell wall hydrolase CwlJ-like protein